MTCCLLYLVIIAGEQLRGIKSKLEQINGDVDRANWMLRGMSSVKGWLWNSLFSKPPAPERPPSAPASSSKPSKLSKSEAPSKSESVHARATPARKPAEKVALPPPVSKFLSAEAAAHDAEFDSTIDSISAQLQQCVCLQHAARLLVFRPLSLSFSVVVCSLQRLGEAASDELDRHDAILDEADVLTDKAQAGLKKAVRREKRIIRS
jgi:hypothetical protein